MSASSSPKLIQPLQPAQGGGGSGDSALRLALLGNPNCGKTALFNLLTGARQKVANYAGVTVERKEGWLSTASGRRVRVLDLPGTYSPVSYTHLRAHET